MTKLIIFFLVVLALPSFAQTRGARPLWEVASSKIQSPEQDTAIWILKQEKFYLGYHWVGPPRKVNELLHTNFFHGHWYNWSEADSNVKTYFAQMPSDTERKTVVWQPLDPPGNGCPTSQLLGLQFDPEANKDMNTPRIGDTSGAILGFNVRREDSVGTVTNNLSDSNYIRYMLHKSAIDSGTSAIVLSEPVVRNEYQRVSAYGTDTAFNGTRGYISINLRRTSTTDTAMDNDTILTITLPYLTRDTVFNNILFDSIAVTSLTVDTLPFSRGIGLILRIQPATGSAARNFVITRAMLPKGNASEKDITISAFFRLKYNEDDNTVTNPPIISSLGDAPSSSDIISLGLDVRYHGKSDVGIDWLRFEVPYVRAFLRSYYDTTLALGLILHNLDTMRHLINTVHSSARLMSFYGEDEPATRSLLAQAHFSRLLGGRWMSYTHGHAPGRNLSYPHNLWVPGVPTAHMGAWGLPPGMPYSFGFNIPNYLGLRSGWEPQGYNNTTVRYDSLTGSSYEVVISGTSTKLKDTAAYLAAFGSLPSSATHSFIFNSDSSSHPLWKGWFAYPDYLYVGGVSGPLPSFEKELQNYVNDTTLIFGGRPWWTNIWVGSVWSGTKISSSEASLTCGVQRPQTGEELRLQVWSALIHGCKGFMFERLYHSPNIPNTNTVANGGDISGMLGALNTLRDMPSISDSLLDSLGERIFDSTMTLTGGDFITVGDSTHMDQYLDTSLVKQWIGVRPSRFYIGRLSTRHEIKRICDFIGGTNGVGLELMKLQLKSWYGKGYEEQRLGDTSLFKKYVALDTTLLRTRSMSRADFEAADSSFLDVTLLQDSTISKDSGFTIGVQNRRTSPFVWLSDSDSLAINRPDTVRHSSYSGKVLTFLTTMEFENYVRRGKLDQYSQSGAREITIPFNYQDTLGRYAMLHVKELGGGIDTIIGQDSPLAVKFLPGEGKMFNVTILHPDAGVAGRLQYSNQRKMVGYPILRPDGTPSDSVYYHLTYHRYDPIAARNSVYYRRSEAVWYNSSSENVTWQPEKLLGEHIRVTKCSGDTIMRFSCAYPSLVVRYDESDSSNKVYVVYSCMVPAYDSCNAAVKRVIVENVFKAESTVDDTARYFDTYIGELSEYGTPMVNASSGGNYYCWSDSTKGIVVGWKPPNARELTDFRPLSWAAGNSSTTLGCKHPSMNSYSRISLGEADCALVWEEKINTPILHFGTLQRTHIFYTRLKMIGDTTIHHFLSPSFFSTGESVSTSSDGSIARMSTGAWAPNAHRLPSVYRDLVDSVVSGSSIGKQRDARTDCLVWSAQEYSIIANPPLYAMANLNDIIYRRTAWINDTSSVPTTWGVGGLCRIWNSGSFLENPSISQGISKVYNTGLFSINESDSAVLIHINDYTTTLSGTVNKLWHIRGNINYLYSGQDTSVSGYYNDGLAKIVNTNGEYGQTAAFPVVSGTYSWRKNRRIYQTDTASPRLEMSPRYFLKASDNDEQIGFIGFSDEESKYMLSSPLLNGTMVKFNRVRQDQLSNEQRVRYYDRVSTDWFTVGDTESLWLKSIGKNSELVMAFVERRNDGARFRVELGESDDTTALWTPIHLRRGGTEEYRFFILKRLTDENNRAITESSYGEEMVLRGIKTAISSQKMGANGIQEIDLGRDVNVGASIRVYPNPAREKVTVVVTDTNQKNTWHVKVMNVLGTILNEHDSKPNTSIEIVTEDYPTGIYYIIAESGKLNATARFVIMK